AARRLARERALDAMHQYADDALARVTASPSCADAVHRAIDREARVVATRPLADGSAVSIVEVDLATVRAACAREGLPWS
ncbi:MAG: hypothetical protein K8H88_01555, partial [Sandaracinaceae bacterium]|nr:hypothetical protein [Sandaracinaceae bacterium]